MVARLDRGASGAKHARWLGEIIITVKSHEHINLSLSALQKEKLAEERVKLEERHAELVGAVTPYRAFIENAFTEVRAHQRVANYLCDEAMRETRGTLLIRRSDVERELEGGLSGLFGKQGFAASIRAGHARTVEIVMDGGSKVRTLPPNVLGPGKAEELAGKLEGTGQRLKGFNDQLENEIEPRRRPLRAAVEVAVGRTREALEQMDGRLRSHFSADFIESLYPQLAKGGRAVAADPDEEDDGSDPPETIQG